MADLASKLLTIVEAILPLAVQVNIRSRIKEDTMGEVPEEANEITKEKSVLMKLTLLPIWFNLWTTWR
jgi:hypothetical protein